jgi:sugar phosphate isomerase/epimerase
VIGKTKTFISSYSYKWSLGFRKFQPKNQKSLEWFIDKAAEQGVDGVQIVDNVFPEELSDDYCKDLAEYGLNSNIEIQWGFEGWDTVKVERLIEISRITNSKVLRGVIGVDFLADQESTKAKVNKTKNVIASIIPELEASQLILGLENHFDLTIHELKSVVEELNHPLVKIILDTTNAIGQLITPDQTIELLGDMSIGIHFKDYKISKVVGGYQIMGVAIGEGDQDGEAILEKILGINPNMEVCIELGAPFPEEQEKMFEIEAQDVTTSVVNTIKYLEDYYRKKAN